MFKVSAATCVTRTPVYLPTRHAANGGLLSFPTRRSSDLGGVAASALAAPAIAQTQPKVMWRQTSGFPKSLAIYNAAEVLANRSEEHTSNSSHVEISYAVFCL